MYEPYPYRVRKIQLGLLFVIAVIAIGLIIWLRQMPVVVKGVEQFVFALRFSVLVLLSVAATIIVRAYHIGYERDFLFLLPALILPVIFDFLYKHVSDILPPEPLLNETFLKFHMEFVAISLFMLMASLNCGRVVTKDARNRYVITIPLLLILIPTSLQMIGTYLVFLSAFQYTSWLSHGLNILSLILLMIAFYKFYTIYEQTAFPIYFAYLAATLFLFLATVYYISLEKSGLLVNLLGTLWYLFSVITSIWIGMNVQTRFVHSEVDMRKSLEHTLEKTGQQLTQYRSLVDQISAGMMSLNTDGIITYINPYFEKLSGIRADRLLNHSVNMLFDSINLEKFLLDKEKWAVGESTCCDVELKGVRSNMPVLIHSNALRNRSGQLIGSHHIVLDFSNRKKYEQQILEYSTSLKKQLNDSNRSLQSMQEEIRHVRSYYERLIDGMLDILLVMGTDGQCQFINEYGRQLLGYQASELNRRNLPDFLSDLNKLQANYGDSMKIELRDYETVMKTKERQSIVVSWNVRFLYDAAGEKVGVMCVGRDISEYKALRDKLQEHSENLERLVQQRTEELDKRIEQLANILQIGEAIILDTDLTRILTTICRAICKAGWKTTILTLKSNDTKIHVAASAGIQRSRVPGLISKYDELFQQTMRFIKDEFRIGRAYYIDPDRLNYVTDNIPVFVDTGQLWKDDACLLCPIKLKNRMLGYIFMFEPADKQIPDEKKLQLVEILVQKAAVAIENKQLFEELQSRAHDLELANTRQSEYFANMSHELRTPLNSILSLTSILLEESHQKMNEEQRQHIRVIKRNGERLLTLINNILDLSKIDAGSMKLHQTFFALRQLINDVVEPIRPLCEKKNLKLNIDVHKQVPEYIFSDRHKMEMVLINLLSNAVKFTPKGKISLQLKVSDRGKVLDIYIKDTGIGLSSDEIQHIFNPFRQAENSGDAGKYGSGLGLSIARQFWQLMGGEIFVSSKKGKGTQFHLALPLPETMVSVREQITDISQPADAPQVAKKKKSDRMHILLVDDNEDNQYALKYILEDRGFSIEFASNGEDALMHVKNKRPDLILMDMMMPGMDGYEATARLRAQRQIKHVPIIAMTAKTEAEDNGRALSKGCNDYLTKPFTSDDVLAKVNKWIGEHV